MKKIKIPQILQLLLLPQKVHQKKKTFKKIKNLMIILSNIYNNLNLPQKNQIKIKIKYSILKMKMQGKMKF